MNSDAKSRTKSTTNIGWGGPYAPFGHTLWSLLLLTSRELPNFHLVDLTASSEAVPRSHPITLGTRDVNFVEDVPQSRSSSLESILFR